MSYKAAVMYVSQIEGAFLIAKECARILRQCGINAVIPEEFSISGFPDYVRAVPEKEALEISDFALVIGGDGTILRAAGSAAPAGLPILGINRGRLGFLSELEPDELRMIEELAGEECSIEERMMLRACVKRNGEQVYRRDALNDVVIGRAQPGRILELDLMSDRQFIAKFRGDGVVIATPTGSTAYSMSAGGPIIEPTLQNMTLTPICAHGLFAKSFVLAPHRQVSVMIREKYRGATLAADGRGEFHVGFTDDITVSQSPFTTKLIRIKGKSVYEVIRDKLNYDV